MVTNTKYFGEVEYEPEELIHFSNGLFGFEEEQDFLLLPFEDSGTLFSLQSVKTPQLTFVVIDPFTLDPTYAPRLDYEELQKLGVKRSEELYYYTMCSVKEPVSESTVNFKCPIAINEGTRQAMQVILENGPYYMRHRLGDFSEERGEAPC